MRICIDTQYKDFYKDFYEILGIFFSDFELFLEYNKDFDLSIHHNIEFGEKKAKCSFSCNINNIDYAEQEDFCYNSECDYKREKNIYKKANKRSLYALLKSIFGKKSPWGSLTGVRPTYLAYDYWAQCNSLKETEDFMVNTYDLDLDKAKLLTEILQVQSKMQKPTQNDIDLYISIPFCLSRCSYCTFPSNVLNNSVDKYLETLTYELKASKDLMCEKSYNLRAVYIGGGTPSALNHKQLALLLENVNMIFPEIQDNIEFTLEAGRPDTLDKEKLRIIKEFNVNRISINPQTMIDRTLNLIGRNHSAKQTIDSFFIAREEGFNNINMDTIVGLPEENLNDFIYTMDQILKLNPESLTIHTLSLKKNSSLSSNGHLNINNSIINNMLTYGDNTARKMNMQAYYLYRQKHILGHQQNIAYSKQNYECLYNVDIMEESLSILAVGAGAISKRVESDRNIKIERAPNISNLELYIERIDQMIQRKKQLFSEVAL